MKKKGKQVTKNQHYVPQFLLRHFSIPNSRERSIAMIDLNDEKSPHFIPNAKIKGQCSKNYTYGEDGEMEKALSVLEGSAASSLKKVIESDKLSFRRKDTDDVNILRFVAAQVGRTPGTANMIEEAQTQIIRALLQESGEFTTPEFKELLPKLRVTSPKPELMSLLYMPKVVPVISDLAYALVVNKSDIDFVISDLGVVLYNLWSEDAPRGGSTGFASKGLLMFMPISKSHLLILFDPSVYKIGPSNRGGMIDLTVRDVRQIKELNRIQCVYAERFIYFSGEENTKDSILSEKFIRSPKKSHVRLETHPGSTEDSTLIHTYNQRPNLGLSLPWMKIKKAALKTPINDRPLQFRQQAKEKHEIMRYMDDETSFG